MGTGRKAAAEPPWSGLSVLVPTKGEGDGDESWKPRCTNPSPPLWALEVTTPTVKFFTQKVREIPGNDKGPGGGETPQALYWSKTRLVNGVTWVQRSSVRGRARTLIVIEVAALSLSLSVRPYCFLGTDKDICL